MKNTRTQLSAATVVFSAFTFLLFLLSQSAQRAYGMDNTLEPVGQARTIYIKGWRLGEDSSSGRPLKMPFEEWYDLEKGRYRKEWTQFRNGKKTKGFEVCDGQYIMDEGFYKMPGDRELTLTISFARVDPNSRRDVTGLNAFKRLRRIDGFKRVGDEVIGGVRYEIWQGEYDMGFGDEIRPVRECAWLCPETDNVGRTRFLEKKNDQWTIVYEQTQIDRDIVLPEGLFLTDSLPGYEIKTSKEEAKVRKDRSFEDWDIYEFIHGSAQLDYRVKMVFSLKEGPLLACWQGVDGMESRDQSRYFENLRAGGDLPDLPVQVFALKPRPNVRDVVFTGYHLAHTVKETERGRRWYEWSLYVPDKAPPEPDTLFGYEVYYRRNVERASSVRISVKQVMIKEAPAIRTEADFDAKVLKAMAELSDNGTIPEQVTYENVLQIAKRLQGSR